MRPRKNAGRLLYHQKPVEADLVIGVPDSGLDAALGYAQESGIPFGEGLCQKPLYRPHLHHPQPVRPGGGGAHQAGALRSQVEGKRIVMVDDSIVRGTTCKAIITCSAPPVPPRCICVSPSPEFISPAISAPTSPTRKKLIACHHTVEEICEIAGS